LLKSFSPLLFREKVELANLVLSKEAAVWSFFGVTDCLEPVSEEKADDNSISCRALAKAFP